jgi:palmitoyltransferase
VLQLDWPHHVPQIAFILIYILAVVMALAVGIMCTFHLWSVAHGETTVEGHDFGVYRNVARSRGEVSILLGATRPHTDVDAG